MTNTAFEEDILMALAGEEVKLAGECLVYLRESIEYINDTFTYGEEEVPKVLPYPKGTISVYTEQQRESLYKARFWLLTIQSLRFKALGKCLGTMDTYLEMDENENYRKRGKRLSDVLLLDIDNAMGYNNEVMDEAMDKINNLIDS